MSRRQETLNWLANLVTERRKLVVIVSVLTALAFATQIPKLKADPAPESLLSSFEGEEYALIQQRSERSHLSRIIAAKVSGSRRTTVSRRSMIAPTSHSAASEVVGFRA